jgi:beta-N-acetylhexosaminidase
MQPAIYGCSGQRLTADERDFFKDSHPAGYILFHRNCSDRDQLLALTDELRAIHGRSDVPILVDQEGGRVARLKAPVWPTFPAAQRFADLYERAPISGMEAARLNAQAIAVVLRESGINVNCLPLLDVRQAGAHDIIGDRALGTEPMQVAALGRAMLDGMQAAGVAGVVKHMPGHGRSHCDSHHELPVVDASDEELERDIEPFRSLRDAPMGMAAHIVYTAWDAERCGTLSLFVIREIIRGRIGFHNFLMSDDIVMHALSGDFGDRARGVIEAGCDVALHGSGVLQEMAAVAGAIGEMSTASIERLDRAMATTKEPGGQPPYEELAARRDQLLAYA